MPTASRNHLTPADYLRLERAAETKSEFLNGEVFAMSGASRSHNTIVANLTRRVGYALEDRLCEFYSSDMQILVEATGLYCDPDVVIVCGEPRFADGKFDTLLNPTVLFDLLSESTESYDRGRKAGHYRRLESLRDYVLVDSRRPSVEIQSRRPDGSWGLQETTDLAGTIVLASIGIPLSVGEIYRRVVFADGDGEAPRG